MGDPTDFSNFMGAVIDRAAFDSIKGYITYAKRSKDARILAGGGCDDAQGLLHRADGGRRPRSRTSS